MQSNFIISNAKIILKDKILQNGYVEVENGTIKCVSQKDVASDIKCEVVDANGLYLSPGFIDVHVHGGGGADFRDASESAYETVLKTHLHGGTTALMPTLSSCTKEITINCLNAYNNFKQNLEKDENRSLPQILGLHMEGPYFSLEQCGAQNDKIIRLPNLAEAKEFLNICKDIKRWAVAPELSGALDLSNYLSKNGITVCVGHSNATTAKVQEAFNNGFSCITHLYSGCSHVHRNGPFREGGVVEAAFLIDGMNVEVIADGCHLPKELLQLIYKIKGSDKIALITDSTRGGGKLYPDGTILYDDIEKERTFVVKSGVAMMPDEKNFAGSIATMSRLVKTMYKLAGVPLYEAVKTASFTPAKMAGVDNKMGSIKCDNYADILLFDDDIDIKTVYIRGNKVFEKTCNIL